MSLFARSISVVSSLAIIAACNAEPRADPLAKAAGSVTWADVDSLSRQRSAQTSTLLGDGNVLVAGGYTNETPTDTAELFRIESGKTEAVGKMSAARAEHSATLLSNGKIWVVGGTDGKGALASSELYDPATRAFAPGPALTTARSGHTATRLESDLVLIAGGGTASVELYDPATGSVGPGPNLSVARTGHTATRLADGRVLFVGGTTDASSSELYDPVQNAVSPSGSPSALLPIAHTATLLSDGRVLVVGGCPAPPGSCSCDPIFGCIGSKSAEVFDPKANGGKGAFTLLVSETSIPRQAHAASLLPSGKVLLSGGGGAGNGAAPKTPSATSELFDPSTNTFSAGPSSSAARARHAATVLPTGAVLLTGGALPELLDERTELFADPGGFAPTSPMQKKRTGALAVPLRSGRMLLVGGYGDEPGGGFPFRALAEEYDGTTGTFTGSGTMLGERGSFTATLLRDGSVLVAGGLAASKALATTERWVPGAQLGQGTFVAEANLVTARFLHTAVLLPDGNVLVVGGSSNGNKLDSAELYVPGSGFQALAAKLSVPRQNVAAVLLATGKVLVAGEGSADLYDPVTQTFSATGAPIGAFLKSRKLVLLPDGRVLYAGQPSGVAEIYDPATGTFSASGPLVTPSAAERAVHLLPSGNVLIAAGYILTGFFASPTPITELFLPGANHGKGAFVRAGDLGKARFSQASGVLADGRVLIAGGTVCGSCTPFAEPDVSLYSAAMEAARRPVLTTAPAKLAGGEPVVLGGTGFAPHHEASGSASSSSASNAPVVVYMPESGQGLVSGTLLDFTDTSITWRTPTTALHGFGRLYVSVNGIQSVGRSVELTPGALGAHCSVGAGCTSGFCADGVCCDEACVGACKACTQAKKGSGADGTCGVIPPELDPADSCAITNGAPCTSGVHCTSGHCADGVCCDEACAGQCEACNEPSAVGQCIAVKGAPRGARDACAKSPSANPCEAKTCDGLETQSCAGLVGIEVECAASSCSAGVFLPSAGCDGKGACSSRESQNCAPAGCDGDACGDGTCKTASDCHPDYRCSKGVGADVGECVLANATECDGDHTLVSADQSTQDCSPYRCTSAGTCFPRCSSSLDCVRGFACTAKGRCVADSGASTGLASCGCRLPGSRESSTPSFALFATALGIGLGLSGARRRRSRRSTGHRHARG